jgi:hypothetical protein
VYDAAPECLLGSAAGRARAQRIFFHVRGGARAQASTGLVPGGAG